jgi:hypothetical protein
VQTRLENRCGDPGLYLHVDILEEVQWLAKRPGYPFVVVRHCAQQRQLKEAPVAAHGQSARPSTTILKAQHGLGTLAIFTERVRTEIADVVVVLAGQNCLRSIVVLMIA